MTTISNTSAHSAAVNHMDQFRRRYNGFVTDKKAHLVFNQALARQTAPSTKLKKTISRLRVKRQGKGWDFINGEVDINDTEAAIGLHTICPLDTYHFPRRTHNATTQRTKILTQEKRIIKVEA